MFWSIKVLIEKQIGSILLDSLLSLWIHSLAIHCVVFNLRVAKVLVLAVIFIIGIVLFYTRVAVIFV